MTGSYRSVFKGQGMEFEEVRPYAFGDDTRAIDWNVTARFQHPYVKSFREERQLPMLFLVDVSGSTLMRGSYLSKRDLFAEAIALLSFAAIKNRDQVGAIFFSEGIQAFFPLGGTMQHIDQIVRKLLQFPPQQTQANLSLALHFLNHLQKRRTICFLLSDLLLNLPKAELAKTAKHHDVIYLSVQSPFEAYWPPSGPSRMQDLETGQIQWIDTAAHNRMQTLKETWQQRDLKVREELRPLRIDLVELSTEESCYLTLRHFFLKRSRRG